MDTVARSIAGSTWAHSAMSSATLSRAAGPVSRAPGPEPLAATLSSPVGPGSRALVMLSRRAMSARLL